MEKLIVCVVMLIFTIAFLVMVKVDMKKRPESQPFVGLINFLLAILIGATLYVGGVIFCVLRGLTKEVDKHVTMAAIILGSIGVLSVVIYFYKISRLPAKQPD